MVCGCGGWPLRHRNGAGHPDHSFQNFILAPSSTVRSSLSRSPHCPMTTSECLEVISGLHAFYFQHQISMQPKDFRSPGDRRVASINCSSRLESTVESTRDTLCQLNFVRPTASRHWAQSLERASSWSKQSHQLHQGANRLPDHKGIPVRKTFTSRAFRCICPP